MWFNRDLFQRLEQLKARHMENSEFTAKELNSVRKRILTLEKQVVDAMNREEEWKRRLAKIETRMIVDQMKVDGVWKEAEQKEIEFEPRVGDLVVNRTNPTDFRKVLANGFGLQVVGMSEIKMYNRGDLVKDFMSEWKVVARREDLK